MSPPLLQSTRAIICGPRWAGRGQSALVPSNHTRRIGVSVGDVAAKFDYSDSQKFWEEPYQDMSP